ncbi:MAG: DNA-processing protein DprA, partial [Bacteroidota bacterium]
MPFPIHNLSFNDFPTGLKEIPQPPETLHYRGTLPPQEKKLLAVVGSRRFTNYGQEAVEYLLGGLARYDIGIISGLALGIDSLAHATALRHNLYTLAIPGGGLDDSVIYPARHKPLARQILESGGALLSEYEPTFRATHWS